MTSNPYILKLPDANTMPGRTLRDGVSAMAIAAESSADAVSMAKAQFGDDVNVMWDNATATAIAASTDMNGWGFRLRIVSPLGVAVFDSTVEADAVAQGIHAATGTLTLTPGSIDAADNVKIDTTYYAWAVDPTTGTPDGTVGSPYLVALGANDTAAFANLVKAINATGTGGVDYAAEITTAHATVAATASNATTMNVQARAKGTAGNSISTTIPNASELLWGATTLLGGLSATDKPSSLAIKMVDALNATSLIAGADFDSTGHVITLASTSDVLGDHRVFGYFLPLGADRSELKGVPGFIASQVDNGSAGSALTMTLAADTYVVPKITALLGDAV